MRAVLDTNVIVSIFVFGRRLLRLREAWAVGRLVPLMCEASAAELTRVLSYSKFKLTGEEQGTVLGRFLPLAEMRTAPTVTGELRLICRDRTDLVFISLAQEAGVPLVSGDKHITSLRQIAPVEVLSPAELMSRLFA